MALKRCEYEVGLRIKARDRTGKWYLASILEVDEDDQDLLVHFEGWNQRHDEWIDFESDRLRPLTPTTAQQFNPIKWEPKVGEEVRARWSDKRLYLAKIMKITSEGEYKVKFRDGFDLTLTYDEMRPTKKPANVPANRLREPLEMTTGGLADEKEEEEPKEGSTSKVRGERGETKSHSQSEKLKLEEKSKSPPTASSESPKAANSSSGTSPQKTTRSGQTKRSKDGENMPTTRPVTRQTDNKRKRSTARTERKERRSSPPEDGESSSSSRQSLASPLSSDAVQKRPTSPKQPASSRSNRSSRDQTSSSTEQHPRKDDSSGREKAVSSPREASLRDRSSLKKSAKDQEQQEKDVSFLKEASPRSQSSGSKKSAKDQDQQEKDVSFPKEASPRSQSSGSKKSAKDQEQQEKDVSFPKEASPRSQSSGSKKSAKDQEQQEKDMSFPKEASPRSQSSGSKKSAKDEDWKEKEATPWSESKSHRHSTKEAEGSMAAAKSGVGREREGGNASASKSHGSSREGERVPPRREDKKSSDKGQRSSSRLTRQRNGREKDTGSQRGDGGRAASRKRSRPSGSSDDSSSAKLRKKGGESGGLSSAASSPQSGNEKTEDMTTGDESLVQQPGRRKEGGKQRDEQQDKARKRKKEEEESSEGSKVTPSALDPPRAISVSVIRTCSASATSSDSEVELGKPARQSTKMATIAEDSGKPSAAPVEGGRTKPPSQASKQDVTIVSISSSRRKAYTPQHVSFLPSSPTKGGLPPKSPIHVTPGYTPDVLFQASSGDKSQNGDKGALLSTTRKLHLPASPSQSDSEAPLSFIKAKEGSLTAGKQKFPASPVAVRGGESVLEGGGRASTVVAEELQSPLSKRELSSSGYNVAILREDSPTQPLDDPAVIFIEPVRIAPDKYTRQQSKSCTEKSSISEDMETAIGDDKRKMSAVAEGGDSSAVARTSVSEDSIESDTSVEVKRLQSCSLVLGEPPISRLRSQSSSSLPREERRSRRRQHAKEEGSKIAIQNIQRFKRMTGLDVRDVAGVGKRVGKSPKEVVINVDHNAFKCRHAGCTKSFRKESLLQWHIKHYHPTIKPGKKTPGLVSKPRPSGLGSQPHSIVKKLAISRVRKTQQQTKETPETTVAPTAVPSAKPSAMEPQKKREPETKSVPSASAVTEEKKETGTTGKSSMSLPPSTVGVLVPFLPLATTLPANITPHKPPLGRPPKRPSTDSRLMPTLTMETPASKRPKFAQSAEETPRGAKPQGVRRRVAASARQHRLKELSDSDGASEEDSMDSFTASWHSFSSESLSLISLDTDVRFLDEEEGVELPRRDSSPGQPSGRGRVYNRYCSGHKDDVIHCMCASFKEEGFMIQCDQCFSWQHGECVGVDEQNAPQDYICFACVHPRALRKSAKYKLDRMWFGSGKLLSRPDEPPFPHAAAVLRSHRLAQDLMKLRDIHHSVRLLLNLASDPSNPQLKHWSPVDHEDTIQLLKGRLLNALMKSSSSLSNDIHEVDSHLAGIGCRTAAVTSDIELGGLTNRIHSPIDQSDRHEMHDDHMDTGEPPSGLGPVDTTLQSLECDSDVDVTCVSHDDNQLLSSSSRDTASHTLNLPPYSLPPEHSLLAATTLSTFAGVDDAPSVDLFSLPLPSSLPAKDESADSILALCGIEGVESIGALLEEVERSVVASSETLDVKATSDEVEQLRAALASEEGDGASMDSEPAGGVAPVVAEPPTQLLAEGIVHCPIPLRSTLTTAVSPSGASMTAQAPQHGQPKASRMSLGLSDHSPFKVVQHQQQGIVSPQPSGEDLFSPASPDFNTFSLLVDLDERQTTVPMSAFAESYIHSDPDHWCARMVLLDLITAVQDLIVQRMTVIEKEIEALPEVDPAISANGRSGLRKTICRKTIQELRHSIPMEQPKLSI